MAKDTRIDLVEELEKIQPRPIALQAIINEARDGEFHDYKSRKHVCGKISAVDMLRRTKIPECLAIAERIIAGEFDEQADDVDRMELRKIVPANMWEFMGL
jgi:hypothetical protein